jgi:hypothetical protein
VPKRSSLIHSLQALIGKSCWRREYSRHSNRQWYILQDYVSLIRKDSAIDTSNFDQEFTSEAPTDSVVDDSQLSETMQLQFQGWSYKGGSANGVRASINDGPSSIIG